MSQVRGSAEPRKDADASKAAYRTESLNPMSAALCPAKPPGLTHTYRDDTL